MLNGTLLCCLKGNQSQTILPQLAVGQNPVPLVNIPIPTNIYRLKLVMHLPYLPQNGTIAVDPQPVCLSRKLPSRWTPPGIGPGAPVARFPKSLTRNGFMSESLGLPHICVLPSSDNHANPRPSTCHKFWMKTRKHTQTHEAYLFWVASGHFSRSLAILKALAGRVMNSP